MRGITIFIDGYLPVTFTIGSDTTEYDVRLDVNDKHSAVSVDETTGDVTFDHLAWNDGSFVTLEDEAVSGSNYMVEFTVKYDFDEEASWDWTQRFALMIGMSPVDEKPIGLMFFAAGDAEIRAANAVSNDIRWFGEGHEGFTITGGNAEQIAAALKGDGLRVRAVRNGDTLTVYFLLGSEWTQIWTKTAEGLSAYVGVTATSPNSKCIVSDISFGSYVAETTDTAAHLVNGDIVYTLDGVQTTFVSDGSANDLIKELFQTDRFYRLVIERKGAETIYHATLNTDKEYSSQRLGEIMAQYPFIRSIERCDES